MTARRVRRPFHVAEHRGRTVVGWMSDGMRDTLRMLIDRFQVETVIEVGSFVGLSACFFAEHVREVVAIDLFERETLGEQMLTAMRVEHQKAAQDQYATFLANTLAYPNIRGIKMPSLQAAKLDLEADLVYIDADHRYDAAKADVEAWTPHARKVICGDDNTDQWPSVQQLAREIGADTSERIWWLPV